MVELADTPDLKFGGFSIRVQVPSALLPNTPNLDKRFGVFFVWQSGTNPEDGRPDFQLVDSSIPARIKAAVKEQNNGSQPVKMIGGVKDDRAGKRSERIKQAV